MRWPRIIDATLAVALAASYPLYIVLDALPRADAVGPPVPDRYPWRLAVALAAGLGFCATSVRVALSMGALWSCASIASYTDAAAITGVARRPLEMTLLAFALVTGGHVLRRVASRV